MAAHQFDNHKVAIVGCGRVGMTVAYSILLQGLVNELVLWNRTINRALGEKLDLEHGMPYLDFAKITATDNFQDLAGSDIVIYAAGVAQQPNESRLDLAKKNLAIMDELLPGILHHAPNAVILIVANPVDVLTYKAYVQSDWKKGRIFGTGTALDTARFRFHLSEFLQINPNSIHAYILGEHGDSSFPALYSASVGGQPLTTFPNFSEAKAMTAYEKAKNAAYQIIQAKGSTYYGIGVIAARLAAAVLRDEGAIFPVSIPLHHYYGHNGVALSVPGVIGRNGVEATVEIKLNWEEKRRLENSVDTIKAYL